MSDHAQITIFTKGLLGDWTEIGTYYEAGIYADFDSIEWTHSSSGGPQSASFNVRRDGDMAWPDLRAGCAVAIQCDGYPVWSGRIAKTPRTFGDEDTISVECEGWMSALERIQKDKLFIQSSLDRLAPISETTLAAANTVTTDVSDTGLAHITQPAGTVAAGVFGGLYADSGPNNSWARVYWLGRLQAVSPDATAYYAYGWRASMAAGSAWTSSAVWLNCNFTPNLDAAGSNTIAGRYFCLYYERPSAAAYGSSVDMQVYKMRLATDAAYMSSGGVSLLTPDTIVKWACAQVPALSTDYSAVAAVATVLEEFPSQGGWRPVSEYVTEANAYAGYQFLLSPDVAPRAIFRPAPTVPRWQIRNVDIADGNADDIASLCNQVVVTYTSSTDGTTQEVVVNAASTNYLTRLGLTQTALIQAQGTQSATSATALGQIYLDAHSAPPFNGSCTITGSVEQYGTGTQVSAMWITAGDVVMLADTIDTATGNAGRKAVITEVKVSPSSGTTELTLDGQLTIIQALANLA